MTTNLHRTPLSAPADLPLHQQAVLIAIGDKCQMGSLKAKFPDVSKIKLTGIVSSLKSRGLIQVETVYHFLADAS
jgi:hypothetical protein